MTLHVTMAIPNVHVRIPFDGLYILRNNVVQLSLPRVRLARLGGGGTAGQGKRTVLAMKVTRVALVDHFVHSTSTLSAETGVAG